MAGLPRTGGESPTRVADYLTRDGKVCCCAFWTASHT